MTDITELALLISKAKASVFTLEYISQFEPADIDSDDVDLRLEVDGRDTGTNVSIVDECGQAAKVIGALVEALASEKRICATWRKTAEANSEKLEKAQQERDNWRTTFDNERFRADKLKAHIDEMTEERNASINELSRIIQKEVKAKRETEQRIAELESRTVKLPAERFCPAEYAGSQLWSETEVWNKAITTCADALRAAGIKVEAE
ncbi:hypothetical protein VBQ92_17080 [Klebsiella pneumoniae]|nr:hypothetical protein [Klebsiella pneumoniae]